MNAANRRRLLRLTPEPAARPLASWCCLLWCCVGSGAALTTGWNTGDAAAETVRVDRVLLTTMAETEVPARETGVLSQMNVVVGQMVRQGQTLARIDDQEAKNRQNLAEIELRIAEKETETEPLLKAARQARETADRNLARAEEAVENFRRSLSQAELDDYRLGATEAAADLWQRQHETEVARLTRQLRAEQLQLAQLRTARHAVTAPLAGMVEDVYHQPGEWVTPGQPIARIVRLDRLRCVGFLAAEQVPPRRLPFSDQEEANEGGPQAGRPGDWAHVTATLEILTPTVQDGPETRAEQPSKTQVLQRQGTVTFIDPQIEPESGQVKIWVEVDNTDLRLHPGDRGTLVIQW